MNTGEIAFREQVRLGFQPMLHVSSRQRAIVHVTKVSPSGDFVRGWHEIISTSVKLSRDH
jgi:hypothetical protein